ncbi:MAG: DEAD/DEAH box helicase, partial [Gammaproteobacteria bacterium]|nr:DEAD/DEAH box helicase [Gammaproteobacteria bacterium]
MLYPTTTESEPNPDTPNFQSFDLVAPLLKGLAACKFEQPTTIQARALPAGLAGRDLMASA